MTQGRVYVWTPDPNHQLGGQVTNAVVELGELGEDGSGRSTLRNELVEVRNGGRYERLDPLSGLIEDVAIGNARPDPNGDFLFEAGKGGGKLHKFRDADEAFKERYVQAAHFGEVNTFHHLTKIASYIDGLLRELGAPSLPSMIAVVNAHHAATETNGLKDGLLKDDGRCVAFQGGHYRLPAKRHSVPEHYPLAATGEIHLGPGRQLIEHGAIVESVGHRYRANASHNAGIIYHEYGHHITRHTADFRANRLHPAREQDNRKASIDEGTCDYFTAVMLQTPHIWALHKRHDGEQQHPRSLASTKTMEDFDASRSADPHANGTIWGAALWDLRNEFLSDGQDGGRRADLLVVKMLLLIAADSHESLDFKATRRMRSRYGIALAKLIKADALLHAGCNRDWIAEVFARRKIVAAPLDGQLEPEEAGSDQLPVRLRRVAAEHVPESRDILSGAELALRLETRAAADYSVIVAGDIMLGDRTRQSIREMGADYPFAGVVPLLARSSIVVGNLEGPFAREAEREDRRYSYRVNPRMASSLKRAGINVVTIANNHLMDCGRAGVIETIEALERAGVHVVGGGRNEYCAHEPVILDAGDMRIGILGYYWNKRCAATLDLPGGAVDTEDYLRADIAALRERVDRIVVTFHWGVPYERTPQREDREKARLAINLGADLVVGHHPHVIQPFEIYKGRAIFYSVGNFTFGSGNSRAEGLLIAARFEPAKTVIDIYPIYVKNRDVRINYQPKILSGQASQRIFQRLAEASGQDGALLDSADGFASLQLPHLAERESVL